MSSKVPATQSSSDNSTMDDSYLFDAIQNGDMARVQKCLSSLGSSTILQDLRDRQGYTPLASAIVHGNLEVLRRLQEFAAGNGEEIRQPVGEKDNLLLLAIINARTKSGKEIVRFVLEKWGAKLAFARTTRLGQSALHLAASRGLTEVFKFLRKAVPTTLREELLASQDRTGQNPLHLSASSHADVVNELLDIAPALAMDQDKRGETPLHKAVEAGQKTIVQAILEKKPEAIKLSDKDGRSAYQLARDKQDLQLSYEQDAPQADADLEPYLKEWTLRRPGLEPATIRRLLFGNRGHDYFLDLQVFENSSHHFSPYYLDSFPRTNFKCESWLQYVRLPELQCDLEATEAPHKNLGDAILIFDSLRKKGVTHILEVNVPDCTIHPHGDDAIIRCLEGLHVKKLDWRKQDLSVATILQAAPEVEEVRLYSSGNRDVLSHWASYEGLYRLAKLQSVEIIIFVMVESYDKGQKKDEVQTNGMQQKTHEVDTKGMEQEGIALESHLKALVQHDHKIPLVYNPETGAIDQDPMGHCDCRTPRFQNVLVRVQRFTPKRISGPEITQPARDQENIFTKMEPFLRFLSSFPSQQATNKACAYAIEHPIRIAIIDNGAASYLFKDIDGKSFIENGLESLSQSHWHIVSNTHGTQMAGLVHQMNQYRRLFIAKACQGPINLGVTVDAAVEAIDWACGEEIDADIISMSWTISDSEATEQTLHDKLNDACGKAAEKRIIFCATGDKGATALTRCPAEFYSTIAIATAPMTGPGNNSADMGHAQFALPGDDLEVDVPAYLDPRGVERTAGSSAATALAAGLASLILTCVRFAYYREPPKAVIGGQNRKSDNEAAEKAFRHFRHQDNMKKIFNKMCKEQPKFVQPWTIVENVENMTHDEVKDRLYQFFQSC